MPPKGIINKPMYQNDYILLINESDKHKCNYCKSHGQMLMCKMSKLCQDANIIKEEEKEKKNYWIKNSD